MNSPNLQKRHFELIAEIVAIVLREDRDREKVVEKVCVILEETNPKFNAATFRNAVVAASFSNP